VILSPFFRKYFLITSVVFGVVILACGIAARHFERFGMERFFQTQAEAIFEQIEKHDGDKFVYVQELNDLNRKMHWPLHVGLLEEGEEAPRFNISTTKTLMFGEKKATVLISMGPPHGPQGFGPPLPPGDMGPPSPRPMGGPRFGPPLGVFGVGLGMPLAPFLSLVFAILLASATSIFLIHRSFRDKALLAKDVLSRMQHGDLKARFTISKWDEASQVFTMYNSMADEIERLVDRLRQNEVARVAMLQELAHDLRTPVSSLHSVIETLKDDEESLSQKNKEELKSVAMHEVGYLKRLVEDLLFLALVLEPKYKTESQETAVRDVIIAQMNAASASYPAIQCEMFDHTPDKKLTTLGTPLLLRRLFRNIFDNACSFAKSSVGVHVYSIDGHVKIVIRDDGPGLSPEALESFGKKRSATRYQGQNQNGRISIGLGSVIIQTITAAHGGQVSIQNILDDGGKIVGAELTLSLQSVMKATA
jgi:signal transduction histidine kinase